MTESRRQSSLALTQGKLPAKTEKHGGITVAWTNTAVKKARRSGVPPGRTEGEAWSWLWESARYDRQELIEKSSVPSRLFDKKFAALVGNRVLYPDGTINSFAQRYLRKRVAELFEGRPRVARSKRK